MDKSLSNKGHCIHYFTTIQKTTKYELKKEKTNKKQKNRQILGCHSVLSEFVWSLHSQDDSKSLIWYFTLYFFASFYPSFNKVLLDDENDRSKLH